MSWSGPGEHGVEHGHRQLAGEGVLLARVVRAEQRHATGHGALGEVAEGRAGAEPVVGGDRLPGELPQRHDDQGLVQQRQLAGQVRPAGVRSSGVGLLAGGAQCTVAVM